MQVIVVGAGIVGVSCAIWLQRAGHAVTLVDRAGPASGTSHGNGGVLAAGAVVPVPVPGLTRKAPRMLFDRDQPLFLRWSYLPRLLPFLTRYLAHGTDAHVRHYARAMRALLHDSPEQHAALAQGTEAARFLHNDDYLVGYATEAAYHADAYGWGIRREAGVPFTIEDRATFAAWDPAYGDAFEVVVRCPSHGRISDPGAYLQALAAHFQTEGGTLVITEVTDIDVEAGAITALHTSEGPMEADRIVLALGPWSQKTAEKLGVSVPFESERGYHIDFMAPSVMPRAPVMVAAGKFVLTPMEGRLRAAGIVEFGGLHAPPSPAPFALLRKQVRALLPDLTCDTEVEWMGHRPAPADSLPLIGPSAPGATSYLAFGHQHVGLTGGAKTGRIIADMISGGQSNADLSAFDPCRHRPGLPRGENI